MDVRIQKLASNLVNYSVELQKGESVAILATGLECLPLVKQLVKETYRVGSLPFVQINEKTINRELILGSNEERYKIIRDTDLSLISRVDACIAISAEGNKCELYDVPEDKIKMSSVLHGKPVSNCILKTKWVYLDYPTNSMAQLSSTSLESFENFYFDVCNLDYEKMSVAMDPLVDLMKKTDKVKITGVGTDLTFSIKNIPIVKCCGKLNIPDGEVYTAPIKNSVNGYITYNTPSPYRSFCYENVYLKFEEGKIVHATANDTQRINNIFDTDEGARYVGEFAIGVNPYITKPAKNTLFDEKIAGSFHFTPGDSYDDANNTNKSSIHWDLVCIQTPEYGGGEIYFDDVLIRKDGIFVLPELQCLNPENLK